MDGSTFYEDGVAYKTLYVIGIEADEVTCMKNGARGGWDVKIHWEWDKMGDDGEKTYWGHTFADAMKTAAIDRVRKGLNEEKS